MSALDELNDKWDAASDRFNLLVDVPASTERAINAAIADWQDFYWGPAQSGGSLLAWEERYMKTAALLDAAAKRTTVAKSVQSTSYYKPPVKSVRLPPLLVTGSPPPRPPVPPPPAYIRPRPYAGFTSAPWPRTAPRLDANFDMTLEPVDTSEWGRVTPQEVSLYQRDAGVPPWTPEPRSEAPGGGKGFLTLVGVVLVGWWAKREGLL